MNNILHQTEKEMRAGKRRNAIEKIVIWFIRWSQLLFIIGLAAVVFVIILIVKHMDLIKSDWQLATIYIVAITGLLLMIMGAAVGNCADKIDERRRRREQKERKM